MAKLVLATLCLFVFSIPIENTFMVPGVGALGRVTGILAFLVGIGGLFAVDRSLRSHPLLWVMLIFVLWGGLSFYWSVDQIWTLSRTWTYLQLLIMMWLMFQWVSNDHEVALLLVSYVLGAYFSAFGTIVQFWQDSNSETVRYAAEGFNPNDLAVTLALGIPLAWHLFQSVKFRLGWIFGAYPMVASVAILLTASRNGFIALCIAFLFILFNLYRQTRRARLLALILGVVTPVLLFVFTPEATLDRLATLPEAVGGMDSRFGIWEVGLKLFNSNPVLGIGAGAFKSVSEQFLGIVIPPHNVYLAILVEEGLIGFAIFLLILWIVISSVWGLSGPTRLMWLNMLLIWGVCVGALNWEWRKQTWLLFVLVIVQAACANERKDAGSLGDDIDGMKVSGGVKR